MVQETKNSKVIISLHCIIMHAQQKLGDACTAGRLF